MIGKKFALALSFALTAIGVSPVRGVLSAERAIAINGEGQSRPAGADQVDAIAQQFKGTHDIAGAAEALNNAVGSAMTYQDDGETGMAEVKTVTELLDQRSMICYEFVHWAAYVAGDQKTIRGASPRLGPSATAAYLSLQAVKWDGASDIPRGNVIVFVARADNNRSGYFHVGISLGGGNMIHFPSVGGVQVTDVSKYYDPARFTEARISDYNWMSAQGDSYKPGAAPATGNTQQGNVGTTGANPQVQTPPPGAGSTSTATQQVGTIGADPQGRPALPPPRAYSSGFGSQQTMKIGVVDDAVTGVRGEKGDYTIDLSARERVARLTQAELLNDQSIYRYLDRTSLESKTVQSATVTGVAQGIGILQYANTQTTVVSLPRPVESQTAWRWPFRGSRALLGSFTLGSHVIPLGILRDPRRRETGGQTSRAPSSAPDLRVYFASTGRSSGPAMSMTVVNLGSSPVNIVGQGFALEPLARLTAQDLRRELQRYPAARQATTTINGYCLDINKPPPPAGMVFRLADAKAQAAMVPLRYLATAARRLSTRGSLHPDTNPVDYEHALLQWALWTSRERFDEAAYARAFIEHGKKNIEGAGRKWTREIETGLRGLTPNRWRDIQQVLSVAAEIAR